MPAAELIDPNADQRQCPVCWTWFTPNSPSNPHPRRYCCGACRIEDSRRRREREQTQLLPEAKLDLFRTTRYPEEEQRENSRMRRLLDERSAPTNPD